MFFGACNYVEVLTKLMHHTDFNKKEGEQQQLQN